MKKTIFFAMAALALTAGAQTQAPDGGITPEMMKSIKSAYKGTPADKAIFNAISNNDINKLAVNTASKTILTPISRTACRARASPTSAQAADAGCLPG